MTKNERAQQIQQQMFQEDAFSQWLGMECLKIEAGSCILQMQIRPEMLNGFGIAHGAITYALADSALAFASNSQGRKAVSIETSISHTAPLVVGEMITARATESFRGNKIANYQVEVQKADQTVVALFKGIVYLKREEW